VRLPLFDEPAPVKTPPAVSACYWEGFAAAFNDDDVCPYAADDLRQRYWQDGHRLGQIAKPRP
jgi:hypothetical protein